MKLTILVRDYTLIPDGLEIFKDSRDALTAFKNYTGFEWNEGYRDPEDDRFSEDYQNTIIYEDVEVE